MSLAVAIHSSDFLGLKAKGYDKMELCPAAPVHKHPMVQDKAVYFSEIIVHVSNKWAKLWGDFFTHIYNFMYYL